MTKEWTEMRLSDLADIIMGQSPKGKTCTKEKKGVPLLNGPVEFGTNHPIPVQFTSDPKRKAYPEDILFCVRGSTTGRMNWCDQEYAIGRGIAAIRHKKGKAYQYFLRAIIECYLPALLSTTTGSTFPNISKPLLHNLKIKSPSLIEQQHIDGIFRALNYKIDLNCQINEILEIVAKTLYDYWFVQFDFPNENGKPYKSSGGKMIWNEELKREIPKDWKSIKLSSIFNFQKGIEPGASEYRNHRETDNHIKFYRVGDIDGNSAAYVDSKNKKYQFVSERDVVVTFDGSIGKIGFGLKGAYSGGLRKIYDTNNKFDNSLIYFLFKDVRIIATIQKYATGSIIKHASNSINHLTIPFNETYYLKFQKITTSIFNKMVQNKMENQKLSELRDWLLPMLMNGQVKISQ